MLIAPPSVEYSALLAHELQTGREGSGIALLKAPCEQGALADDFSELRRIATWGACVGELRFIPLFDGNGRSVTL